MKSMAIIMALAGTMAGTVSAAPTYKHSWVSLGGGLYGHTFTCDNTGEPASAWYAEMEWHGASQAEVDAVCEQGAIPGSMINQVLASGFMVIHEEEDAILCDIYDPSYDMALDTWIKAEFCYAYMSGTPTEGANSYYVESGTQIGMPHVTVPHAYIVSDGSVAFTGQIGTGADDPVWTQVSGVSCVPEPATLALLAMGGLALLRRRSAQVIRRRRVTRS